MCHFERQRKICLTAPSAGRAKGSYQPAARIAPYPNPFANDDTYGGVDISSMSFRHTPESSNPLN